MISWNLFYSVVGLLLVSMVLCVLLPWLWHRRLAARYTATNTALIRQRLKELDREAREGLISEQDKRQAADELKLSLVDDESAHQHRGAQPKNVLVIIAGAVIAIVAGGVTYSKINQLDQVSSAQNAVASLPELSAKLETGKASDFSVGDIQNLILAIRYRLQQDPNDAQGWMFLGRLLGSVNQSEQAMNALQKAYSLTPESLEVVTSYVQLKLATGQRNEIISAQRILTDRLHRDPDNTQYALMLAVASAKIGDLDTTRKYYHVVKDALGPQSDILQMLASRISQMQSAANAVSGNSSGAETTPPASTTSLTVTVKLDDKLTDKLPENGYLIVFVQDAASSNKAPAAVVRQALSTFPATVTLTDDNAMMAGYTLSTIKQAKVTARISADQNVMPASGDWQGVSTLSLRDGEQAEQVIVIDKELK